MNGLFLQGGGAKGAFQAGVIYALSKRKITFNVISGTSIGAINGYYIYTNNIEAMRKLYIGEHSEVIIPEYIKIDKVIDNGYLINTIDKLEGKNKNIEAFYVNYTEVNESRLTEKIVNLCELDKDKAIECVKYSSLLPYPCDECGVEVKACELMQNFDSKVVFEGFKYKVISGEYDGHNLDGGIMNNNLLNPFLHEKLDKIYIIPLNNSFQVPEYLYEKYKKEDIIVIRRLEPFQPQDTLRFQPSFLKKLFYEGYNSIK